MRNLFGKFGIEESGIHGEGVIIDWLDMSWQRNIPIDNSFFLITESIDFLLVTLPNERLIVISDGGIGPRNIISVQRTHQAINIIISTVYNL